MAMKVVVYSYFMVIFMNILELRQGQCLSRTAPVFRKGLFFKYLCVAVDFFQNLRWHSWVSLGEHS